MEAAVPVGVKEIVPEPALLIAMEAVPEIVLEAVPTIVYQNTDNHIVFYLNGGLNYVN